MSVSVPSAVVTISGLGISGPLAVVSTVSVSMAVTVAVTSIAVSSAVVAIAGLGISGPLAVVAVVSVGVRAGVTVTVVAVAGLSGSSGLGISLSLRLGISRPLAVVSTVSAIPVIASPVSSIAIATAVVTISGLGRHHSEEGDGESDQKFHVLSS